MPPKNEAIKNLLRWAATPEFMTRFTALTLYTQRVKFVKQMLGLTQRDEFVGMQMRAVCEEAGVAYVPKKGPPYREVRGKSLTVEQRFHVSTLLNMLRTIDDAGVTVLHAPRKPSDPPAPTDQVNANALLDRMISSYGRYLQLQKADPQTAEVPFELYWFVYQRYLEGDVDMTDCRNCGSGYVNLRMHQTMNCPVCASLKLAKLVEPRAKSHASRLDTAHGGGQLHRSIARG